MKKYKILLAAAALLGLSSCIEETLPTEYVLNDQIQASESALQGMVNSIYTSMGGYINDDGGIEMISYGSMRAMLEHSTTQFVCSGAGITPWALIAMERSVLPVPIVDCILLISIILISRM